MPSLAPAGMFTLPLAVFAGLLGLAATASGNAPEDAEHRVQLEVAGVLPMTEGAASILVLRERGARTILPLIVPDGHAFGPGPGERATRDGLLPRAIEALGGKVAEVDIDDAQEVSSGARVVVAQGTRRVELHALPSESVALAVATGVPIVTSRRVLDAAGLTPDDLARAQAKDRAAEEEPVRL